MTDMDIDFHEIRENISDRIGRKPHVFIVTALLGMLFALGLAVLFIQSGKPKAREPEGAEFVADEPIASPDEPIIEKDYYPFRTTESAWGDEDVDRFFAYPDAKAMSQLESVNDKIVDEITGAAP